MNHENVMNAVRELKKLSFCSQKIKIKKMLLAVMCITMMLSTAGCGRNKTVKEVETATNKAEEIEAIHAGTVTVFFDEAKYYAYTTQATYEAYYIAEDSEIDWNSELSENVTWEQGIKSTVLDDICRRECMYSLAGEYNVSLSESDIKEIDIAVKNYYSETNKKLMLKIGVSEKRLKYIFEKAQIAKKVEAIMLAADKLLPDATYEKWKTGNTVTAEKQWQEINFKEHIFTLEDAE